MAISTSIRLYRALRRCTGYLTVSCVTILILLLLDRLGIYHLHRNALHQELLDRPTQAGLARTLEAPKGPPPVDTITVAAVACSNRSQDDDTIYNETAVMFKSILISCKVHGVKNLEFHLFLEHQEREEFFMAKIKEFGLPSNDISVGVHFHPAVEVVPEKYWYHMIFHKRFRCGYVRAFFPLALPDVESLIYLDTDIIITGDITQLWSHLYKMTDRQVIAMGRNNEPNDTNYRAMDKRLFGDIPHIKPKGLNSGVIVMNMTKMRLYGWEEKIQRLYDAYRHYNKRLTVQRVMNILLFYNPELLYVFPCQYHFIHTHCEKGLTCQYVDEDPGGIYVLHGANSTFQVERVFRGVYENYEKFDMKTGDVTRDLVTPIREYYAKERNSNDTNPCDEALYNNLFKRRQRDEHK